VLHLVHKFIHRHLDPVDRLGEVLFGLIMALGFTAAVRLGHEEADSRALLVGILGCNVAWGIVDGVMYVLASLFERGREAQMVREVLAAPTDEAARERVVSHLDGPFASLATDEERGRFADWVVRAVRRSGERHARIRATDLLGGVAVAVVIMMATAPMLVPYLLIKDPAVAVHVSHAIGLAMLFSVGVIWGRKTGSGALRIGAGVTLVGAALVLVTVLLGG
jgi:VIT1/CCC1 family predicted Fe2+/Mn2+ transporter